MHEFSLRSAIVETVERLDFDTEKLLYNLQAVHPGVKHMLVSARSGQGVEGFRDWLARVAERTGAPG